MAIRYVVLVLILCVCFIGCRQQEEDSTEMPADTNDMSMDMPEAGPPLVVTDAMLAKLAAADAADGHVDKVIEKCVTCKLEMDGKPEYAVTVGDYSVQLCSATCEGVFEKDPAKALLALAEE